MPKHKEASRKALELWTPPAGAGVPLACIATTFTFDAGFFESDCLGRFLSMEFDDNQSDSVAYLVEREEKLSTSTVCVCVDRRHACDKQSLRWDVIPVMVPRGVQHAKLTLLAWGNHVRVIIGSGNLTRHAYRSNLEVFGTLELSRRDGGPRKHVLECLNFLDRVAQFAIGDARGGPIGRARKALNTVRRLVRGWKEVESPIRSTPVFGEPGKSVINSLREQWPASAPPWKAYVASPFFDAPPHDELAPSALLGIMVKRRKPIISFAVPGEQRPNGEWSVRAAEGLLRAGGDAASLLPIPSEQEGERRPFHAKILNLASDEWLGVLIGSSNFTAAGLGVDGRGNLEANLFYRARWGSAEANALDKLRPDTAGPVDLASVKWKPCDEQEESGFAAPCLPAAFKEALFLPSSSVLRLVLDTGLPAKWKISVQGGDEILSSGTTLAGTHDRPWSGPAPLLLQVDWRDQDGSDSTASWPVNVSDPGELPSPEALRSLRLDDLLEVLASTRSFPQAIARVIERRRRTRTLSEEELDPHKRVNTHGFLLQRTRRLAAALDRLRETIEGAVVTQEAMKWRLQRSAVGPLAVADALVREQPDSPETRFYLAEIILTLRRVKVSKAAEGGVPVKEVQAAIDTVLDELKKRLSGLQDTPVAAAFDMYVKSVISEVRL
jgi:hypothetical protein